MQTSGSSSRCQAAEHMLTCSLNHGPDRGEAQPILQGEADTEDRSQNLLTESQKPQPLLCTLSYAHMPEHTHTHTHAHTLAHTHTNKQ